MITVKGVDYEFYECDSCAESEKSSGVEVKSISIQFDDSNHSSTFRLCKECFEQLKNKF